MLFDIGISGAILTHFGSGGMTLYIMGMHNVMQPVNLICPYSSLTSLTKFKIAVKCSLMGRFWWNLVFMFLVWCCIEWVNISRCSASTSLSIFINLFDKISKCYKILINGQILMKLGIHFPSMMPHTMVMHIVMLICNLFDIVFSFTSFAFY